MIIRNYLCHVVGEHPKRVDYFHPSTLKRMKAFAIAIHIPVTLWAMTGYVIASRIFSLDSTSALAIAAFCASLIYMVERLVLATPKVWYVNLGRVAIGIVIAVLGASTVDLVIFEREVGQHLRQTGEVRLNHEHNQALASQLQATAQSKADWFKAQDAANCEADGTCGSRLRSVGPVYRQLARQAELLRLEYAAAQTKHDALSEAKVRVLEEWRSSSQAIEQAGLLMRVEALHQYTMNNNAAFVAWLLFFTLLLFFELMVIFVKLVFGETVDDKIDMIREQISHKKVADYMEAITSPLAGARKLLDATY